MKKTSLLTCIPVMLVIAIASFSLPSCKCKEKKAAAQTHVEKPRDFAAEGYTKLTVVDSELDGCRFLLQFDPEPNGPDVLKRLEPTNLKEEFKKDQLAVWVKYAPKKGAVSTCMAGPIVEISDIQLRK